MKINVTDNPAQVDEDFVIDSLWAHNDKFDKVDIHPLFITLRDEENHIAGGLVARTRWGGLEVQYLWVSDDHRAQGFGRQLMLEAEKQAIQRGCHMAYVDTFSFGRRAFMKSSAIGNMVIWAITRINIRDIIWRKISNRYRQGKYHHVRYRRQFHQPDSDDGASQRATGIKDRESRHIYMNKAALLYTNTPLNFDIVGKTDAEFPADWAECADDLQEHDRRTETSRRQTAVIETHYWFGKIT